MPAFNKILIANRGAIARRVVRACQSLGIPSVVLFSDADAQAPYLAEASETYHLPGNKVTDTYLNQDKLLQAIRHTGADAVHPGYGFLSEHAEFAQAVCDLGVQFVGPQPKWLQLMGDKVAARSLMADQGFPTFGGSQVLEDLNAALATAEEIGYPVMLKPAGGGGGMGMHRVDDAERLQTAYGQAQAVAQQAFANGAVYLEKYIERPRHIEYQILADNHGEAMHVYERECSVQRRHQKLIEECPAPNVNRREIQAVAERAASVCATLGYNNVGTLETLLSHDGATGFLEMNTRIQVEHGVTEMVTGLDLVAQQIQLAGGASLPSRPACSGVAIEARLYAEDSVTMLPSTGRLTKFEIPNLHGVRVETGFCEGQTVTPYYDALLAKVISHAHTRELAIGRLVVALKAFVVSGVQTNAQLLIKLLTSEQFMQGEVDTGLVDTVLG